MCYFDNIMRVRAGDIDFSDILLDAKLYKEIYKNILIFDISYKTLTSAKPLRIWFDKIDGFIKIHGGIRCLVLFDCSCCDEICDRIKYLISEKSGITDSINLNFARIRIDSYDSLPIEKILSFRNEIILINSVINKYINHYYFNTFLKRIFQNFQMNVCIL